MTLPTSLCLTRWSAVAACCAALLLSGVALAAVPIDLSARLRLFMEQQPLPFDGEVEVIVGEPDPRLNLAACAQYEPFVPPGTRLWGRASLGMRCVAGANWVAYVPIQVKVYGPAVVASRPIARGLRIELPHPRGGSVPLVANPIRYSATPVEYRNAPPMLGRDTASALGDWLGCDASRLASLVALGAIEIAGD